MKTSKKKKVDILVFQSPLNFVLQIKKNELILR